MTDQRIEELKNEIEKRRRSWMLCNGTGDQKLEAHDRYVAANEDLYRHLIENEIAFRVFRGSRGARPVQIWQSRDFPLYSRMPRELSKRLSRARYGTEESALASIAGVYESERERLGI